VVREIKEETELDVHQIRPIKTVQHSYMNYREPKVWFESLQSMAQILSNENQELLKTIVEQKPASKSNSALNSLLNQITNKAENYHVSAFFFASSDLNLRFHYSESA
jgi:basic membrane lipoprotein Med (substrate-binding protein (PBP1-ABC) superfamily)